MTDLQRYFIDFHDKIRLAPYDENKELREKRDLLLKELREKLPADAPAFRHFNQGSYAMNTGVEPMDGNYDIDIGLEFDCYADRYFDPVELKREALRALERHNRTVRIRRPCVTVEYLEDGKVAYHVDLAIYVQRADGVGLDLAIGRENCSREQREWQQHDPKGLIEAIQNRFSGEEAAQMRRAIRYMKIWRDHRFPDGNGPISVALTVAAYYWFLTRSDPFSGKALDAQALRDWANTMLGQFQAVPRPDGQACDRLVVLSPVVPRKDLLARLSDTGMEQLRSRLQTLVDKLQRAIEEPRPELACQILSSLFPDFPVPATEETARAVSPPYIQTGQSA